MAVSTRIKARLRRAPTRRPYSAGLVTISIMGGAANAQACAGMDTTRLFRLMRLPPVALAQVGAKWKEDVVALLADAIRSSESQAAIYRAPQGYLVIVERVTGRENPDTQEGYIEEVDHGDAPPSLGDMCPWRIGALDLVEALERMRGLGIPDFDPEIAQWRPALLPGVRPPVGPDVREDYLVDELKH
jgi:hypothetical protein